MFMPCIYVLKCILGDTWINKQSIVYAHEEVVSAEVYNGSSSKSCST